MFLYLGSKTQKIEDKDFLNVSVLSCDNDNCNYSVARFYVPANDVNENRISYFSQFNDITEELGFKVRNDGKVVLTLK